MANQPETATYDAGVLQLQTTDPVQGGLGGVSNTPLLSLANRTAYLKQHVDNLESGATIPPTVAPKDSPTLTGDPKAPTPALGDNDTSIPTTAFVQATVNGVLSKSVAGGANVTLTAVEAGNGILKFTGVLTANIAVIVPATAKALIASNQTTGAYSLTVKTAAGTGIVVAQGKNQELWCDGMNVLLSTNDFTDTALVGVPTAPTAAAATNTTQLATTAFVEAARVILAAADALKAPIASPALTGTPTAPTPAQFDNSLKLATSAFVRQASLQASANVLTNVNKTLTNSDFGSVQVVTVAGVTITMPAATAGAANQCIKIWNASGSSSTTVQRSGTDTINFGSGNQNSFVLKAGDSVTIMCAGAGQWFVIDGLGAAQFSNSFGASLATSGYQKLPSGIIVQWGGGTVTSANVFQNFVLPTAFISAGYSIAMNFQNSGSASTFEYFNCYFPNSSSINISAPVPASFNYIAIGQ